MGWCGSEPAYSSAVADRARGRDDLDRGTAEERRKRAAAEQQADRLRVQALPRRGAGRRDRGEFRAHSRSRQRSMKETGPCCEWPGVIPGPSCLFPWAALTGPAALRPTGLRGNFRSTSLRTLGSRKESGAVSLPYYNSPQARSRFERVALANKSRYRASGEIALFTCKFTCKSPISSDPTCRPGDRTTQSPAVIGECGSSDVPSSKRALAPSEPPPCVTVEDLLCN